MLYLYCNFSEHIKETRCRQFKKGDSLQVNENGFYNGSVEPKPSAVPSRIISPNTSTKSGQGIKRGIFLQQLRNSSSNIPTKIKPPNSLAPSFSRSCSSHESMPFQPAVASTSHVVSVD